MARILLVDDDPDQLEVRRMLFQQAGHEVYTAVDAGTALDVLDRAAPQLVVTDLRLPKVEDGLALIRAIRQRATAVRIVVLSGWTSDIEQLPEAGLVDAIVGKPARTNRLLALAAKLTVWMFAAYMCAAPGASAAEMVADLEITSSRMERVELALPGAPAQHVAGVEARVVNMREVPPDEAFYLPLAYAPLLQYTVIFTNEDGGTPTRGLMARWGRTTGIEYIYRAYLKPDGSLPRAIIQGRGHQDIEFAGRREGRHPLLIPVTRNNMVSGEATSLARFQLTPQVVNLPANSRELVMDLNPFTYRVAGEKIGDPRSYLYLDAKIVNRGSAVSAFARLKGERRWRSSHLGRVGFAIERDGWVRTTVELPPGATPKRVASIGFECIVVAPSRGEPLPNAGRCRLEQVGKAFFHMHKPVDIPTGEMVEFPVL